MYVIVEVSAVVSVFELLALAMTCLQDLSKVQREKKPGRKANKKTNEAKPKANEDKSKKRESESKKRESKSKKSQSKKTNI